MRQFYATLDGKTVVPTNDVLVWGRFFEQIENRRIGQTFVGEINISTIFLGLDHQYREGPPHWFETMIFGGEHDGYCERYSTYEEAEAGHVKAIQLVEGSVK